MIASVLLFISIALTVHYLVSQYRRHHKIIDLIPGPKSRFLVGNVSIFQGSGDEIWNVLRKLGNMYYPIYRLWFGPVAVVHIRHPDDVETILGNTEMFRKSKIYSLMEPWFGTGLLTSSGAKWQKRRKMLTPAFHFNVLQQFVEIFIEEGERMIQSLKKEGGSVVNDLQWRISQHTLNIFCETALGYPLRSAGEFQQTYTKAVHDASFLVLYRSLRPWFYLKFIFDLAPTGRLQNKLLNVMHGFAKAIISERKAHHDQTYGQYVMNHDKENANVEVENENDLGIRKKRLAMLDLLLAEQRKNNIDGEGIREEVDTFMFVGHDTSALSACYTIMLLAEHKEIQERARAEVNAVLDENDGKMSLAVLQQLTYLERCIKESLRLYPVAHDISRDIEHPVRLSNYEVPKGTTVHINIVGVHRDPNFWPEPEVFDPDRFLPEKIQERHPYSYIPFSAGLRNCIGQRYAMFELKAIIGNLLRNFYLEPIDYLKDVRFTPAITIQPAHPLRAKFIPIKRDTKGTKGTQEDTFTRKKDQVL